MTAPISYDRRELEVLSALEERHFWFRVRRRIIIDALARWFPQARDYLEIGSGTGYVVRGIRETFPDWRVLASDPLAEDPAIQRIDARDIPFAAAFDVIGAYDVLEHIEDDRAALAQLHRACRPGGGVVLTVPQHPWLWSPADTHAQHHRRYECGELLAKLRDSGFAILGWTSFNTINMPLFWLRCRLLRARRGRPVAAAPAAPLNWLLGLGMEADRRLIRTGVALPLGGSVLVAARRAGP